MFLDKLFHLCALLFPSVKMNIIIYLCHRIIWYRKKKKISPFIPNCIYLISLFAGLRFCFSSFHKRKKAKYSAVVKKWALELDLLFSHPVMSNSLWPHVLQHARLPHPSPSSRVCPNSCQLSMWCHPTISLSVVLLSPSSPALNLSQHQGLFQWVSSSHQVASFSINPFNE